MTSKLHKPTTTNKYEIVSTQINMRIANNLKKLIVERGYSIRSFTNAMEKEKTCVTRQYLGELLNYSNTKKIPVALVLLCCDFFGITIENLVSENFNPKERLESENEFYNEYIKIEKILEKEKKKTLANQMEEQDEYFKFNYKAWDNSLIISDPDHTLFRGYLQDYYCYFFPTNSRENRKSNKIIKGILSLSKNGTYCKATLKVDPSGQDTEKYTKIYTGYSLISNSVKSIHCIMFGKELGEFCFLMFRHFALNEKNQFCRISEVLSSSSGGEERRPTVLRMFLSKEKIKKEHIHLISSAIRLNYSEIAISEEKLLDLEKKSPTYKNIINDLINLGEKKQLHFFNEQEDLFRIAKLYTESKEDALEFIADIRNLAYSFKYNKVSDKADSNIASLLMHKGYYQ